MHDGGTKRDFLDRHSAIFAGLFCVVLAGSVAYSVLAGTPGNLPGFALESDVVFHLGRGLLMGTVVVLAVLFVVRGASGSWPIKIRDVEWAQKSDLADAVSQVEESMADLQQRFEGQREAQAAQVELIQTLDERVGDLIRSARRQELRLREAEETILASRSESDK